MARAHLTITKQYYALWLDTTPEALDVPGVVAVPSRRREVRQAGYSKRFSLYAYVAPETTVISYACDLAGCIDDIVASFRGEPDLASTKARLAQIAARSNAQVGHGVKYVFTGLPPDLDVAAARRLTMADYADFLTFHKAQYPGADQETWLRPYFDDLANGGHLYAVFADRRIVSAAELPDVPYLADRVAEPGINTLAAYRRRGYARIAVGALLRGLLDEAKTPLWSCAANNIASQRLAESLGFARLADVVTFTPD